uniref:Uncharacterized protein n=1 Tax=viral metagenome TaxID=1070528 RepID=A0A6C0KTV7_9ZZZZ
MCWSLQASLVTWVIGLVTGVVLLCRRAPNDITLGLLILTYSSMQLWEAMMWYDQKCGTINQMGTKLAYIALWSHVLAMGIGLYLEQKVVLPVLIGFVLLIYGLYIMPTSWMCSKPGKNGHLAWGFDASFYMIVFGIALLFCLIYLRPISHGAVISFLFLFSFALSYWYGFSSGEGAGKSVVGSFWCWVCAAFAIVFLLLPYNEKKND